MLKTTTTTEVFRLTVSNIPTHMHSHRAPSKEIKRFAPTPAGDFSRVSLLTWILFLKI
jgi:microcystin-dependent protein